jgi:hypothetical protein
MLAIKNELEFARDQKKLQITNYKLQNEIEFLRRAADAKTLLDETAKSPSLCF